MKVDASDLNEHGGGICVDRALAYVDAVAFQINLLDHVSVDRYVRNNGL